jgi:hypothetical protein
MRLAAPHAPRVHEVDSLSLPSFDADHSRLPATARYGVAVVGISGSGTGVGSGVAVGTGVGSGSGVGIGAGVAKIPRGSRSRRYISQCPSGKQTHSHFSGQHSSRIHGSSSARSAVQYQTRASAQVYVLPRQSQQVFGGSVGSGVGLGGSVNGSYEVASG